MYIFLRKDITYSLEVAEKSVEMTCMEMPTEKKCVMALQAKCSASSTR